MKLFGHFTILAIVSAAFLTVGCAMDEIVVDENSALIIETDEDDGESSDEIEEGDDRFEFNGELHAIEPVAASPGFVARTPGEAAELDFRIPGADILGNDEPKMRDYNCSKKANFTAVVNYQKVSLFNENGDLVENPLKYCAKACDYLASDCNGFFYLSTDANGSICGLVNDAFNQADWTFNPEGNADSQVCFL